MFAQPKGAVCICTTRCATAAMHSGYLPCLALLCLACSSGAHVPSSFGRQRATKVNAIMRPLHEAAEREARHGADYLKAAIADAAIGALTASDGIDLPAGSTSLCLLAQYS